MKHISEGILVMRPQLLLRLYQTAQTTSIAACWCKTEPNHQPSSNTQTTLRWGIQHCIQQRFDKALKNFQVALENSAHAHDLAGVGRSLNGLSAVYLQTQEYERSLAYSQASALILEDTIAQEDYALAVYQLGVSHLKLKNLPEAERHLDHALTLYNTLGDILNENRVVLHLGQLYTQRQEFMFALACYESVLDDLLEYPTQDTQELVFDVLSLIMELYQTTHPEMLEAFPCNHFTGQHPSTTSEPADMATLFQQLGQFHEAQTRYGLALEYYARALRTVPPIQLS